IFLRQADGRSGTWICEGTPGDRNSGFVGNLAQVGSVDGVTLSDAILDNRGCDFQDQQWDFRLCRHSSCSGSSITLFDSTDLTNTCSSDTQTCY
ncbi:MAG TPA: hypothetical protein PKY30_22470, partial [Myxococcota bacterium]|nr:hypothetical protein [Myxococcota bacterium]